MSWIFSFRELVFLFAFFQLVKCAPSFIFFLTDDQDVWLNGLSPMVKTRYFVGDNGAVFNNMFVTTPLCCPSRASILTGRYAHNHGVRNNSINGNCNSLPWQQHQERNSFITQFKQAGYSTFYAGKYLNEYGMEYSPGGVKHIPPGWDFWFGLVGNSVYYNYSVSVNGEKVDYGSDPKKDYLTNVITREALKFLQNHSDSSPFFMFISPPAPHSPFTPLPQDEHKFSNLTAPRTPNYAVHGGQTKHWLIRQPPKPLPEFVTQSIDDVFRNRWRTLLPVDDSIYQIIKQLEIIGIINNTYIFVTSDNGFHLGQFSLPWDKRQLYEFDVRVPLLVRGPRVQAGIKIEIPVLNIDLAPTFLELANLPVPTVYDGKSFAAFLTEKGHSRWRDHFIIEHSGESTNVPVKGCAQYKPHEVHTCEIDCICEDSRNNSYICVRELSQTRNAISCIFKDDETFHEAYNISADPFQMNNIFYASKKAYYLLKELRKLF